MSSNKNVNIILKNPKTEDTSKFFDDEWVKSTFIITDQDLNLSGASETKYERWVRSNRYSTSADHKFSSTSPGMSMAVNPKPQFTRYCDIRSKGRLSSRPDITVGTTSHSAGLGMGGYYSQAFDDNEQRIFLRFGVPKYMPLLLWISKAFDINKTVLQGRGVITSTFLDVIGVTAKFFAIAAAPLLAVGMFALNVYVANSRFYSVRDTMYIYWATVENILNMLVARRTMLPYILKDYTYKLQSTVGNEEKITADFVTSLSSYIPDIVNGETGRINVFAIALRAQATFNSIKKAELDANKDKNMGTKADNLTDMEDIGVTSNIPLSNATNTASTMINRLFEKAHAVLMANNPDDNVESLDEKKVTSKSVIGYDPIYLDEQGNPLDISLDASDPTDSADGRIAANVEKKKDKLAKYGEYMLAELSEGAAFAVFNVETTGSVGESFSSSFGANPIEATFNAMSAKARNLTSLLSSAADIPVVGAAIDLAADAGAMILSKASFGLANPLLALAYGVNVSMPKVWESSSADLPKANYKIKLISPYGNAYSQLFNIYLPFSMLLAGSLPRSTGNSTYMSPFFCQLFDRGRNNIQMGMISSLAVTRGTSNLAFTRAGHPNSMDVDIAIANLDEIVAVDVTSNGVLSNALANLSPDFSDTPFVGYMNTVAGVDVYTQIYRVPMLRLKLAERFMNLKSIVNPDPAAFAAMTVNTIPFGGLVRDILGDNAAALQSLNNY